MRIFKERPLFIILNAIWEFRMILLQLRTEFLNTLRGRLEIGEKGVSDEKLEEIVSTVFEKMKGEAS